MNPSTAQARVLVDEFIRCGVVDAVVAPGSRSTPLAIALAEAEERGELVLHVRIDERSAGFLALGLAKVSGLPSLVVTTSGTAAVNLHPAIVEADESGIPLLALTADRPPQLRDVGANQSIVQVPVFGGSVRSRHDLAIADLADPAAANRYWRSTAARAVAAATDSLAPGPVHLNIPFTEPLVPDGTALDAVFDGRPDGRPWTADARLVAGMSTPLDDVLEALTGSAQVPGRGVIVVGDHDDAEAVGLVDELADAIGWPVIGEPSGNAAACDTALAHGPLLCADPGFAQAHVPDLVITVGRVGLNRAVMRLIARAGLHIAVDAGRSWSDPTRSADVVVASVPLAPEASAFDASWLESWQRADLLAAAAVETVLAAGPFTGMDVARVVTESVPSEGLLFIGPSWPIRHVMSVASLIREADVLCNRGTSGIDGCISTAWGAALAHARHEGAGSIALVGDLAFLYDSNGLIAMEPDPVPDLVIVVSDNNGGGIFSQLEQGAPQFEPVFERVFGTPHDVDIVGLAQSLGVPAQAVDSAEALRAAIEQGLDAGGVQVVVARTCARPLEAQALVDLQRAVGEALGSS